ncbi:MAG: AraC family transcriptional regulator, partial [Spirochaetaceae bacterium]|nr:AraC family transcriptional regulator [Spirochaetaceae bacterium]
EFPVTVRSVAEGRELREYSVAYIDRGRGIFECSGETYNLEPGDVIFIKPGVKHRYHPLPETGWHEYWVGFKGWFFDLIFKNDLLVQDHVFFRPGLNNRIIDSYNLILNEVKVQRPLFQFRACSGIVALIAEILTIDKRSDQPNHYQTIVEKAKAIMKANCFDNISMPAIARRIGASVPLFNEIFKAYTSMTPYQYFIHIKIQKAQDLLEQEDISVKETAFRLGFKDQYHFSRLFKSKTGYTPSEWKK